MFNDRKSNGPGVTADESTVRKPKSRKDQRHDQRVKEDELRKVSSKEQPTNVKKDRKVFRELNSELKVSNLLDAREKRLAELKYLLDIEDDEDETRQLKAEIKAMIRKPMTVEIVIDDSDEEIVVLPKAPASSISQPGSEVTITRETLVSPPQQTELWGDEAASEYGENELIDIPVEAFQYHNYHDRDEDSAFDSDSDTQFSNDSNIPLPLELPTRISPRRNVTRNTAPIHVSSAVSSSSYAAKSSSSATSSSSYAAATSPPSPKEDLYSQSRRNVPTKKRKITKK